MTIEQERLTPTQEELRPEVLAFALLMERQLRANDHKPGWKGDSPESLFLRVQDEARELTNSLGRMKASRMRKPHWAGLVGKEAADVANFAMMIADVCGALPALKSPPIGGEGEAFPMPITIKGRDYQVDSLPELLRLINGDARIDKIGVRVPDPEWDEEPMPTTSGDVGKLCERLAVLLERSGFTRLSADEITDPDPDGVQEVGWRIHDMPDEPNAGGVPMAFWLAGGMEEYQANLIVEAVNGLPAVLALLTKMEARTATLFEAIKHGDEDHRAWLKEAIDAHFAGQPVPAPRGQGNKEARISALEKALEPFASQHMVGETLMTCEAPPWAGLSPEQRLAMLAERKQAHDANILIARALLNPTPTATGEA